MNILEKMILTETPGVYELILQSGEELTVKELQALNRNGYLYDSAQTDIDYEDIDENGVYRRYYMDIHYFYKMDELAVAQMKETMSEHFPM